LKNNKKTELKNFKEIEYSLTKYSKEEIFLVKGKKSFDLLAKNFEVLNNINKNFCSFSNFSKNPKWDDLEKGKNKYNLYPRKVIIAIGGGSVIDMAKLIKYYGFNSGLEKFIVIPTTAGSGSESTHFAVLYKNGKKFSISHPSIKPDIICLNEDFIKTNSLNQLSISGLDALSQSIESLWSKLATEESKKYALEGFRKSLIGLESILTSKINYSYLMEGSNLSGKAIDISKTTAPHALSYYLTSKYHIQHGYSVALTLPFFFIYNLSGNQILVKEFRPILKLLNVDNYNQGALKIFELVNKLPINKKSNFQLNKISVDELLCQVNNERLKNNPKPLDKTLLKEYLKNPLEWLKK
jgi:alcohol dehydrogenase class IV